MQNLYNIVAELCATIVNSCSEEFFVRYSCVSPAEKKRIYKEVQAGVGSLFLAKPEGVLDGHGNESIRELAPADLTEEFFSNLQALIGRFTENGDYYAMLGLLQILDQSMALLLNEAIGEFEQESFSIVLNTNRESVGVGILPRCSCIWERKHRLVHRYNNLESFLYNILLIENSVLGELIDEHYFLKKDLFPRFGVRNAVKIAATPLRRERNFKVKLSDKDKIQYFNIAYENPSFEADNELIWKKIWSAGENESDIVVFPELLGNAETAGYVAAKIKSLQPAEAQKIPSLIILPSYWEKNRNVVTVMDKIGRIAIMVCRDFLETEYMRQLMRCFKLTLIIVPSFSTGSYDFRRSFDLCAHEDCNVVWINTCAALIKGKEANFQDIGYVRKRISRNEDEAQMLYKMPICDGAFKGACAHDCIYYETIQGV